MPRTILGKVSLAPRGEYSPEATYTALDVVSYRGSSWLALKNVTGVMPEEGESWMLLAQKGDQGEQGIQGIQGIQGETGGTGPTGPQGASFTRLEKTAGTGAPGTIDMYTAYNSDDEEAGTIKVYNGMDGIGAGDFKADGTVPMTGNLQMAQHKVTGLADATDDGDAVNKGQMDEALKNVKVDTDATPTEKSTNPVQSGGVYTALAGKADLTLSNLSNKQKALRNIGGRPNRNLLDNWYFVGGGSQQGGGQFPINQRGETSRSGSGGFIDRWKLSGEGTATLGSDGITLTATTGNLEFMQFLGIPNDRLLGETVCLSGLVDGDLLSMSTSAPEEKPSVWTNIINIIKPFGFVQFNYDNTADRFFCSVIVSAGNSVLLQASKLELGSTQTLAYQDKESNWKLFETPDYAGELAECQRYFVQFRSEEQRFIGIVHLDSDNYGQGVIWTPVQMRAIPTVSGAVSFYGGGNNGLVASVAPLGVGATAVRVNITLQDAVSTNSIVFLHSNDIQGGPVTLSAEL